MSVIVIVAAAIVIVRSLFLRRRGAAASAETTMDLFTIKAVFSSEMSWFGRQAGGGEVTKRPEYSSHWLCAVLSWPVEGTIRTHASIFN